MNRHRIRIGAALALALFFTGCRGCQRDAGSLVDLAAPDARAVVVVPSLAILAKDTAAFSAGATKRAGKDAVEGARRGVADQLGFDPFDAKGWKTSGIAADRGLVLFTEGTSEQGVLGVHVSDKAAFGTWMKGLAQRAGASKITNESRDGVSYENAARPFGAESVPVMSWGFAGDDALIAAAEATEPLVAALKRLSIRASGAAVTVAPLSKDPAYVALTSRVADGDVRLFARGKEARPEEPAQSAGIAASIDLSASGLRLDSFVDFKVEGLSAALDGEPPLLLGKRVEDDAVVVALARIAKPEALAALRVSPVTKAGVERALDGFKSSTELDAEKDLMQLLAGPLTIGVHVMDLTDLPKAVTHGLGLGVLLSYVHVSVTAEVKDRGELVALLDKSRGLVEQRGGKVVKRTETVAGKEAVIYEPEGEQPSIGWGIIDNFYVYGAGRGRLARAMAHAVAPTSGSVYDKLKGGVAGELGQSRGSLLVAVRAGAFADNVAKLSGSQDPMAMALMPMISQGIEVLRTIGDVAVAARVEKDGVRVEARQKLQ